MLFLLQDSIQQKDGKLVIQIVKLENHALSWMTASSAWAWRNDLEDRDVMLLAKSPMVAHACSLIPERSRKTIKSDSGIWTV